jgi:tripartite ATP-independent transporter DctP family solute receptor
VSTIVALAFGAATVATAARAEVTLRVASEEPFSQPPALAAQFGLEFLEKAVAKETNGAVTVKLYPGAALGNEKTLIRSVATGVVDAIVLSPGNAAGLVPQAQLFSASYLFGSYDHVKRVLNDDKFFNRFQAIVRGQNAGFQIVGFGLTGTRNFYTSKGAVKTLDDLKGIKMRVMASPTEFKVWSSLGTLPTNIPAPESYTSIQTGVVDAAESSIPAIVRGKYYEVAPYISLTHHQFNLHLYLLGDQALNKVPEDAKPGLLKAFREAGRAQVEGAIKLAAQKLDFLRSQPRVTVTDVDTKPFAATVGHIQAEVAKELQVEDLYKMIDDLR